MTSRKTYDYTEGTLQTIKKNETFTYRSDGWKDQLLTWNGKNYTYDAGAIQPCYEECHLHGEKDTG